MRGLRGLTIVLDDLGQLPDQRFGLLVSQLKVHRPDIGAVNPSLYGFLAVSQNLESQKVTVLASTMWWALALPRQDDKRRCGNHDILSGEAGTVN
jgi:hypothetical protein